jgi:tetratricopeptide (TPR) repeat protein
MRIDLSDSRARWTFLSLVFLFSSTFVFLSGKAWLAEAWGSSEDPRNWQAAARLEPGNALYWERLGLYEALDLEDQSLSSAVADLRHAVELNPRSAGFHDELANAYERQGDYASAQDQYELAVQVYPKSADAAWSDGNFLLRRGQLTAGFKLIRRALKIDSSLTVGAISECLAVDPDVNVIVTDVLPKSNRVYLAALNYFVSQGYPNGAGIVWNKLLKLGRPFSMAQAIPFIDQLIAENRVNEAMKDWDEALAATKWPRDREADESVVFDGGFEHELLNGGFDWREIQQADIAYSFDGAVFHSGRRSLRIEFQKSENLNFQHVYQYVMVEPRQQYRLTAFLQTEGISSDSGIRFEIRDPRHPAITPILTQDVKGTTPWTRVQATVMTDANTHLLEIVLRRLPSETLNHELRGTAWIDDVALRKVANGSTK